MTPDLMRGLSAQHLRFTVEALESIVFDYQPGSALRGALYQALSDNFCSEPDGPQIPEHSELCPVCWLLAAEDHSATRGQDMPRAITVEPPLDDHIFHAGRRLTFGYTLIGRAQELLPYLVRAVQKMGRLGVGKGRGRFRLVNIAEVNPLRDDERVLLNGKTLMQTAWQITSSQIEAAAGRLHSNRVALEFLTPMRLTAGRQLIREPDPVILMQRLLERCQRLAEYYSTSPTPPSRDEWYRHYQALTEAAKGVQIVYDDTEWLDVWSGSRRKQRVTPIGGLVGAVHWEGELAPLLPWIVWGASLHVGKNAVKGNGWYRLQSIRPERGY